MKTDLVTAIVAAILGAVLSYFVTNLFIGPIEDFSFSTINSSIGADVVEPDVEIFNFKALNPTVEVYVGECKELDENGECIVDDSSTEDTGEVPNDEVVQENE